MAFLPEELPPPEYGLYLVTFHETDEQFLAKVKFEQDKLKFPEYDLKPEPIEPDTVYLYADDPFDAIEKAEKQYKRDVKLVQKVDTSREDDPAWMEQTFGGDRK